MKQLILLFLSVFIYPTLEPEPSFATSNRENSETINLEDGQSRILMELDQVNKNIRVCNLKIGESYTFSISGNANCQPLVTLKRQKVARTSVQFKANQTCEDLYIRASTENAGCTGTYWLSVYSEQSVEKIMTFVVLDVTASSNSPVCEGEDILLMSDVSGGTPPYSYSWTGPDGFTSTEQNPVLSNSILANGGIYTVMAVDSTGDMGTADVDVQVLSSPSVIANCNAICEGGDLQFFAEVSGGEEPYVFEWSGPNGFTSDIEDPVIVGATSADNGTYTLIVTDQNGCSSMDTHEVEVFASLELVASSNSPVCIGANIELMANAMNGTPPYSFSWTGPDGFTSTEQNPVISGAASVNSGIYIVMATDSTGSCAGTAETEVSVGTILNVTASSNSPICMGSDIQLMANATGGTTPFSYSWTGPNGFTSTEQNPVIPAATTAEGGVYMVTVMDTTGCSGSSETEVIVSTSNLTVNASSNSPICEGEDLQLMSDADGGIPPYSFSWTGPNGFSSTEQNPVISGTNTMNSGIYTVMVTDSIGCSGSAEVDVIVNQGLMVAISSNSPICEGDDIMLMSNVAGGIPPYSYSWIGPNVFTSTEQNPTIDGATAAASGIYMVIVTDSTGCAGSVEIDVKVNVGATVTASSNSPICEGQDLQLMAEPMGGLDPYSFDWTGPNSFISTEQNPVIAGATPTAAGTYVVIVSDENGCMNSDTITVEVFPSISVDVSSNSPICEGETLELMANPMGGIGPYTYTWGGPFGFNSTEQNPTIAGVISVLSGTYSVTVTDTTGCTVIGSTEVEINANPIVMASNDGPICAGADVHLMSQAAGGSPGYTYSWSGPGGFASTEQNPTIVDATTGASGTYVVMVTDSAGCTGEASTDVLVNPNPEVAPTNNSPLCEGEDLQLMANASGGTPPYSYTWNGPGGFSSFEADPTIAAATVAASGTYTVLVIDTLGCIALDSTIVIIHPNPTITASNNGPLCEGDDLELMSDVMGGTAPFIYSWSGPGGFTSSMQNPTIGGVTAAGGGTYTVMVMDANGCTDEATTIVIVHPNPTVTATSNSPICENDNLELMAEAMGGTGPYTYMWDRLTGSNATKQNPKIFNATSADAGNYSVTATDANGCTAVATTNVVIQANITDPGEIAGDEYFCGPGYDPAPITSLSPASGASPIEYFWMKHTASKGFWEVIPGATGTTFDPGVIYETTQYSRCARRVGCQKALETNIVTKTIGSEVLTQIDGSTSTCVDVTADFSVPDQPGVTYSWDFGWGATPQYANTNAVSVSWNTMGVRFIKVTVSNGTCTAYNMLPIFVSNDPTYCSACLVAPGDRDQIDENNLPSQDAQPGILSPELDAVPVFDAPVLNVYPNPFKDILFVKFDQFEQTQTKYQITDTQGKLLGSGTLQEGNLQTEIDMVSFVPGIYIISLDLGEYGIYYEKVIKH